MAIDYEREGQPHETQPERQEFQAQQSARGTLPVQQAARIAQIIEQQRDEDEEGLTVGKAVRAGFAGEMGGSPVGGLLQIGEAAEEGLSVPALDERMERFPELQGVELETGAAARFPELGEKPAREQPQDESEDELFSRR